jgi:hypothetical protein
MRLLIIFLLVFIIFPDNRFVRNRFKRSNILNKVRSHLAIAGTGQVARQRTRFPSPLLLYHMIVSEKVIVATRPFPVWPKSPRLVCTLLSRTTGSDRPYLTPPLSICDFQCLIDAIKTISLKSSPRFPLFLHMLATQAPPALRLRSSSPPRLKCPNVFV